MTINRTTLLDLPLPVTGTESGTWGDVTNNGLSQYVDIAVAGMNALTSSDFHGRGFNDFKHSGRPRRQPTSQQAAPSTQQSKSLLLFKTRRLQHLRPTGLTGSSTQIRRTT
jgi:hypothetical protein